MTIEDQIRHVLDAKAAALVERHAERLDALIHKDFSYVNSGGRIFDKAGYIEVITSGKIVFTQQRFADLVVKLIDNCAVATISISDEFDRGTEGEWSLPIPMRLQSCLRTVALDRRTDDDSWSSVGPFSVIYRCCLPSRSTAGKCGKRS